MGDSSTLISSAAWVTCQFEGWHAWPAAPEPRAYLATPHRHLFKVLVELEVFHDDREIEFHDLLDFVRSLLPGPNLGAQSCEMMAKSLGHSIRSRWPGRDCLVSVSEDGEVGARVFLHDPRF